MKLPYISKFVPYVSPQTDDARSALAQPSFVPWLHIDSLNLLMINQNKITYIGSTS